MFQLQDTIIVWLDMAYYSFTHHLTLEHAPWNRHFEYMWVSNWTLNLYTTHLWIACTLIENPLNSNRKFLSNYDFSIKIARKWTSFNYGDSICIKVVGLDMWLDNCANKFTFNDEEHERGLHEVLQWQTKSMECMKQWRNSFDRLGRTGTRSSMLFPRVMI